MIHVCLILHAVHSSNLGVGALTVAQVDILRGLARRAGLPLRVTCLDWQDKNPPCISGPDIEVVTISGQDLINPAGVFSLMRAADLVIDIGAGDSFADIYGQRRLRRVMWLKALCHLARRPLIVAPQTLGPFTRPFSRWFAKRSLRRSTLVFARDEASVAHLRDIGFGGDILVASDVAMKLPAAPSSAFGSGPHVGINVSGLMMSGGYGRANDFGFQGDYGTMISELIERLLRHPQNPKVHLVPHVISPHMPVEDDLTACETLHRKFPDTILAPGFDTPSEAKGYIAGLDFFAGARMHACIAAFSSGVAVVPMAYSRKFEGLFGALDYPHLVDCRTQSPEVIIKAVIAGFENRTALASDAVAAHGRGLHRLLHYETALSAQIQRAARRKKIPAKPKGMAGDADAIYTE